MGAVSDTLRRYCDRAYRRSPADNLASIRARLARPDSAEGNSVVDDLLALPHVEKLIAWSLRDVAEPLVQLGEGWDWQEATSTGHPPGTLFLLRHAPSRAERWQAIDRLKEAGRVITVGELLLPFSRIVALQGVFPYYVETFDELALYYLGERFFGPLEELDRIQPLAGQRLVEFGPLDGCQTLGLLHLGAEHVTAVEARAENALKTQAAVDAFGFADRVTIVMDDMHAVTAGSYDLAFAHGVYYHSIAPLVFLENLLGLAPVVFLGGFCATDDLPATPWESLHHDGRSYRVKSYREFNRHFTGGVNRNGYFFHPDDLRAFFTDRGWALTDVSSTTSAGSAGNYSRFLARRP